MRYPINLNRAGGRTLRVLDTLEKLQINLLSNGFKKRASDGQKDRQTLTYIYIDDQQVVSQQ